MVVDEGQKNRYEVVRPKMARVMYSLFLLVGLWIGLGEVCSFEWVEVGAERLRV